MAKAIVQYESSVLPSGKGGEVMTPYKDAGPLTPINIGAAKAQAQAGFGQAVSKVGETLLKIQAYERDITEQVITNKLYNDFVTDWTKKSGDIRTKSNGISALSETFLKENYEEPLSESRAAVLSASGLSAKNKMVLEKLLLSASTSILSQGVTHQKTVRDAEATNNIAAGLQRGYNSLDNGADLKAVIQNQNAIVALNGGGPALAKKQEAHLRKHAETAGARAKARLYDSVYTLASQMENRDVAEQFVRSQKLGKDEPGMLRDIKTSFETQEAQAIKAVEDNAKKVVIGGLDLRKNYSLTLETVKQIANTEGIKNPEFWYNALAAQNKAIRDHTNLPFETDNGAVLAGLLLSQADPSQPRKTPTDLLNLATQPDTISIDTANALIKTMDVRKDPVFVNTEASLKTMFGYEGVLTGFGAKSLGGVFYNNAVTEILADLAKAPLKGAELKTRMYELAEPYLQEHWASAVDTPGEIKARLKAMGIKQSSGINLIVPPPPPPAPGVISPRKLNESAGDYMLRVGK